MKRQQCDSEVKSCLQASYYKQTPSKSVGYHETAPERFEIAIAMDTSMDDQRSGFSFSTVDRSSLSKLVKTKSLEEFAKLGGVKGISYALQTDGNNGIKGGMDEIQCRTTAFGANTYRTPPAKTSRSSLFVSGALLQEDPMIAILLVCSALLLGVGIKVDGLKQGWFDGGALLMVVLLVVIPTGIRNFTNKRMFRDVLKANDNIPVEVVRDGRRRKISISDVVVGEVVRLKIGDQLPADGLFIAGHSLLVDESSMTGESNHVEINGDRNPFLCSGAKVADGCGIMLVTSVGMNTDWGKTMSTTISHDSDEQTPLQARLNKLTSPISIIGLAIALLFLLVLLAQYYFTGSTKAERGSDKEFNGSKTEVDNVVYVVVLIIADAMSVVAVAFPRGLSSIVTLTFGYSMKRMMPNIQFRKLSAFETMGMVTTICTDIPPSSSQLKVNVVFIGTESLQGKSYTSIAPEVLEQLWQGISLAWETVHKLLAFTQIDDAIHEWAVMKQNMESEIARDFSILRVEASGSETRGIGIVVKKKSEGTTHAFWRGDAETIIALSSHYVDTAGNMVVLDEQERERLQQVLDSMASSGLLCIGFAHKQLSQDECENENDVRKIPDEGLILSGYVGLEVPHHHGIKEAVRFCELNGVSVKMITSNNVVAAKALAKEYGILSSDDNTDDELVVEGMEFRNYTVDQRMERIDKIRVMARSSPEDKRLMVKYLKEKGHVVAMIGGYNINDALAFMESDVSLAMGIQSSQAVKGSSDIVLLDDNFTSAVTVMRWGRHVYTNIQKFLQFQLTINLAALAINIVAAIFPGKTPMVAVQLLGVNLVINTLASVALAAETPSLSSRSPGPMVSRNDPIITNVMGRNILGQASYQIAVILLLFQSEKVFGVGETKIDIIVFNTFMLLQVFNLVNARKIHERNVFEGIMKNVTFVGINGMTIVLQVVMVQFMSKLCGTNMLNLKEWGICIGMAMLSWPIGLLVKFIPVPTTPIVNQVIWWRN